MRWGTSAEGLDKISISTKPPVVPKAVDATTYACLLRDGRERETMAQIM